MGLSIKKTRRQRKFLELIGLLLKVDDKILNAYIETGKVPKVTEKKEDTKTSK